MHLVSCIMFLLRALLGNTFLEFCHLEFVWDLKFGAWDFLILFLD